MDGNVGLCFHPTYGWIAMKICTDLHESQWLYRNDFGGPLTLHQHEVHICGFQ